MGQTRQPQAIFPDLPRESPAVDKNGDFNELWNLGLSSLFQALQTNFTNEGILFPPLTANQQSTIQSLYDSYIGKTYNSLISDGLPDISGKTIFDRTNFIAKQFIIAKDNSNPTKITLAQWVPFTMIINYAGNPNNNVSGVLNWLCYDSTSMKLFICTLPGSAANATWIQV